MSASSSSSSPSSASACPLFPSATAARSDHLTELRLAQWRSALLPRSSLLHSTRLSSTSLLGAVSQLDCPIATNWSTAFTTYVQTVMALAPVSGCTILVVMTEQSTSDNFLLELDVRTGITRWSLRVSDGDSVVGPSLVLSPSLTRVYLPFYNHSGGCSPACYSVSAVAIGGVRPELLWNVVLEPVIVEVRDGLQVMRAQGGQGEEEMLVAFNEQWVTLDARSGRVLSRFSPGSGDGPYQLGNNSEGRVLMTDGASAIAYQLHSNGSWMEGTKTQWQGSAEHVVLLSAGSGYEQPRLSSPLLLQSNSAPDHWRAVDEQTGKEVWSVSGYDIFTGRWVQQEGCKVAPPQLSLHPLNSSWALVSARAFTGNGSFFLQHTLMELSTGQLMATSPLLELSATLSSDIFWYAASGHIATTVDLDNSPIPHLYLAYHSTLLQPLSTGALPSYNPLDQDTTMFAALQRDAAAVVSSTFDGQVVGQRFPAVEAETEEGDRRGEWMDRRNNHARHARVSTK